VNTGLDTIANSGNYILDNGHEMGESVERQAGAHRFSGIFAFEALRRIFDDAIAEEFLLVKYQFKQGRSCATDVHGDSVNLFECDQIDAGLKLSSSSHS
jgi:hypothetical protein